LLSGKPGDAKSKLATRLAADPNNPALLGIAWRAYLATARSAGTANDKATAAKDTAEAEKVLRKLIEVDPSNLEAYSVLGQMLYEQGRLDEAKRDIEQYLQRSPKDVGAHTFVGIILELQNRRAEAQKKYELVIQLDPNAAVAANNLAWIYAEQNTNLELALQLAETAKSRMPADPRVDDTLGWVYYKKGLYDLAIASFKRVVAAEPEDPSYHYHLGLAYAKKADKANARASLEKALSLKPDFEGAAEAKKILATLG
jgi:Flp pilus assembly protein TadD